MDTLIDRDGRTALHYAALENNIAEVQRLIEAGLAVDAADKLGWTALHFASQEYSLGAATVLIEHGAPVESQDSHGNTPLAKAVFNSKGRGELIALLRKSGAEPHHKNMHGVSPLSLARSIASHDVRQFFNDIPE